MALLLLLPADKGLAPALSNQELEDEVSAWRELPRSRVSLNCFSRCNDCQIGESGDYIHVGSCTSSRSAKAANKFLVERYLYRSGVGGITDGLSTIGTGLCGSIGESGSPTRFGES